MGNADIVPWPGWGYPRSVTTDPFIGYATKEVRFERLLGKGAMGAVYQGLQLSLQRKVAIKVIGAHLLENPGYIARFEREAQTVGQLIHPNIIACHDFGHATGPAGEQMYLMILEFVDGWSLGTLASTKRLSVRQVLELHRQAAEGLAAAHRVGIVHRDIKPDNIMVTKLGQAKLADFGLARQTSQDSDLTAVGTILGSPAFMSPEACRGKEPSAHSDLYSLGCSLLQTLTGATTFAGSSPLEVMQEHINAPVPSIGRRRPEFAVLQGLIDRSLAKDPAHRFRDGHAFAQALSDAAATTPRDWFAGPALAKPGTRAASSQPLPTEVALGGQSSMDATIATSQDLGRQRLMRILTAVAGAAMLLILGVILYSGLHGKTAPAAATPVSSADRPGAAATSGDGPGATTTALPAATPAAAPLLAAPATDAGAAPDPADSATLAKADALLRAGALEDAQDLLDNLMVSGALKQRKAQLQIAIDSAWIGRQNDIESQLNTAAGEITASPQGAVTQLEALVVPDRFPVLDQRRTVLLARAQAALAAGPAPSATSPDPDGRPGVAAMGQSGSAALPLAGPDAAIELSTDREFTAPGISCPPIGIGSALVPPLVPFGPVHPHASVPYLSHAGLHQQVVPLTFAAFSGTAHDGALLLVRMAKPGVLRLVRHSATGAVELVSMTMAAKGWETVAVDLGAPVAQAFQVLCLTDPVDGVDQPFVVAAVARGHGVQPTYAQLAISPGTLIGNPSLDDALVAVRLANRDFPRFDRLHLTLPYAPYRDDTSLLEGVVSVVYAGLVGHPRRHDAALRGTVDFSINNRIPMLPLAAVLINHRADFYLQLFATSAPPPATPEALAEPLLHALHQGVLPVVILGADDWNTPALRKRWQAYCRLLRQQVPGVPILDLAQVPLTYQVMNQPIDLTATSGKILVGQGLAAGLRELRLRISAQFSMP